MVRLLLIGDVHCVPLELEEVERLNSFIFSAVKRTCPDKVVFLGDIFHTHDVLSAKVISFWFSAFSKLRTLLAKEQLILLKGNHDLSDAHNDSSASGVAVFKDLLQLVDTSFEDEHFLYLPYYYKNDTFINFCNKSDKPTVICHQTFNGSQYENGFYAKEGVMPDQIKQKMVISGHIHKYQKFDKIFYTGSPRWRSVSDANENKYIWSLNYINSNKYKLEGLSTKWTCRPIKAINLYPKNIDSFYASHQLKQYYENSTVYINLYGVKDFIMANKDRVLGYLPSAKVRIFQDEEDILKVRESQGLAFALKDFIDKTPTEHQSDKKLLWEKAKERISWL